jgi:hypothetical protein
MTDQVQTRALVGNRLALAGTVLYLLEWVAIVGAGGIDVLFKPGTSPPKVLDAYAGHSNAYAWAAGWFSEVLLGRALFAVAVRRGLISSGLQDASADFAVLAMTAGVVFETAAFAMVMGAAILADHGATADMVAGLDTSALSIESLLWGPTGLAVLALAWAMFRSSLFPRALCAVGGVGGILLLVDGLVFNAPRFVSAQSALQGGVPLMWVWMLWTGVLMWRRGEKSR